MNCELIVEWIYQNFSSITVVFDDEVNCRKANVLSSLSSVMDVPPSNFNLPCHGENSFFPKIIRLKHSNISSFPVASEITFINLSLVCNDQSSYPSASRKEPFPNGDHSYSIVKLFDSLCQDRNDFCLRKVVKENIFCEKGERFAML